MTDSLRAEDATAEDARWRIADPATAEVLGLVAARPGIRSAAFAIDVVIWLALAAPAVVGAAMLAAAGADAGGDAAPGDRLVPVLLVVAGSAASVLFGFFQLLAHGRRGVTAGKAMLRLRSIRVDGLGRPGFWRIVLRALVIGVAGVVPVAGPLVLLVSGLWDPQRRGRSIPDRIAGCWLIDARGGLDPFDTTALRLARKQARGRPASDEGLASLASDATEADALRIVASRSRAGVVGPGGTGAQWRRSSSAEGADAVIDAVPAADGSLPAFAPPPPPPPAAPARSAPPAAPAAPAAPAPAAHGAQPAPGWALRFDDGSVLRVPQRGLLGRDPQPVPGEVVDARIALEDPQRLLSKTHAAFGLAPDGVWVADRGSRNGTQLRSPGGDVVPVPVEGMLVPAGWAVQLGGRAFEVVPRSDS